MEARVPAGEGSALTRAQDPGSRAVLFDSEECCLVVKPAKLEYCGVRGFFWRRGRRKVCRDRAQVWQITPVR